MQHCLHRLRLLAAVWAAGALAHAETVYVDQRVGTNGNGTLAAPHNSVLAAISNKNASTIVVYPGTYAGALTIDRSLKIISYDGPQTTRIESSDGGDVVTIGSGFDVWLDGLNLSSGRYGILEATSGTLHVRNCIVCGNSSHGLYLPRGDATISPTVFVYNCIIAANGGSGIFLNTAGRIYFPNTTVFNTILIANTRYGLETYTGASYGNYAGGTVTLDFNCCVDNAMGSYLWDGADAPIVFPTGTHSITAAPEFVGGAAVACHQDFRLLPTSPCRNAGHPGIGFLNPDGTRNDLGAYGGPWAQSFFTQPNDGPIVRSLTIDQGVVPRGSTFTIRATGAVR